MKLRQFFIVYFGVILLNVIGVIFPDTAIRDYVMYLHFPLLIVMYYLYAIKKDKRYVVALAILSLGVLFLNFSHKTVVIPGLVCYIFGISIYTSIIISNSPFFTLRRMIYTIPIILFFFVIGCFSFLRSVDGVLFYYVIIYVIIIAAYIYFSILNFVTHKTGRNVFLLIAAILLLISTFLSGYSFFISSMCFLTIAQILSFWLVHFFMALYMLEPTNNTNNLSDV